MLGIDSDDQKIESLILDVSVGSAGLREKFLREHYFPQQTELCGCELGIFPSKRELNEKMKMKAKKVTSGNGFQKFIVCQTVRCTSHGYE